LNFYNHSNTPLTRRVGKQKRKGKKEKDRDRDRDREKDNKSGNN